jgi:hypothetical protein
MNVKKIVERIQEISPNLGTKGEKMCTFTIDEDKAVVEIYELMVDLFVEHKKNPFNQEELDLINPLYKAWYGLSIEEDVIEERYKEENLNKRKDLS